VNDNDFDDVLDEAEKKTNEQLKDKIAALTKLTAEDLQKIAPTVADKNALLKLMEVVRSTANDNDKKAQILSNIEMYAGIILNIAGKFLL
jgi:hypothetical protein